MIRGKSLTVCLALLLSACSLPSDFQREPTTALTATHDTILAESIAPLLTDKGGQSGVYPLGNGLDAFVARLGVATVAERSIDLQYYLFHDDDTGRLLAAHLLQAADRGVRVRLLLDDMDMAGRDADLASLALHPNISIRLFNPFPSRTLRYLDFITHFGTVTRRMHNKSFTVDNQATIVGGRNIGDEYFEAASGMNFGDMDVLAVGPIVQKVSAAFDLYWNSELAYPVSAFGAGERPDLLERARDHLNGYMKELPDTRYGQRLKASGLVATLERGNLGLLWGEAKLLYDLPEKVVTDPDDRNTHLGPELLELVQAVEQDLILVSPYFVPGEEGTTLLSDLVANGRRVTVLTNSLAATDVPAVHAGYARYRKALLEAGVEIYEMPPNPVTEDSSKGRFGSSNSSLHAKTLVFDGESVVVGSMNLDPRSSLLNTEMGILIESQEFAEEIARWRDETLPKFAWRVALDASETSAQGTKSKPRMAWIIEKNGQQVVRFDKEPEASFWAKFQVAIARLLPIEKQL